MARLALLSRTTGALLKTSMLAPQRVGCGNGLPRARVFLVRRRTKSAPKKIRIPRTFPLASCARFAYKDSSEAIPPA
jgi:hypothetical protein